VNASLLPDDIQGDPHAAADAAATRLRELTGAETHDVALVMGSGWGPAVDALGVSEADFPVTELPGFPPPAVEGHGGRVRSYKIGDKQLLVFLSRTHYYEGKGVAAVVHGVRTAAPRAADHRAHQRLRRAQGDLDARHAGADQRPHQPHGRSPIEGANFVDLTDLYSYRLRTMCREVDPSLDEGVYVQFPGARTTRPGRDRMVRAIGGHLVGMSTTLEAIAAREAGMEVLGISLVTNLAAGISGEPLNHAEVLEAGRTASTAPWSSVRRACAVRSAPGPNRMNRVVVIRAAAGLAAYLKATGAHRRLGRDRVRRPAQLRRLRRRTPPR
jgi:purine-nucleoside phosphorylase